MRFKVKLLQFIAKNGYIIALISLSMAIIVILLILNIKQEKRLTAIEDILQNKLVRQTELIIETGYTTAETIIQDKLDRQTELIIETSHITAEAITTALRQEITETNNQIQHVFTIYSTLLTEQQKRTLDSLYTEANLIEREQDAARQFRNGEYALASTQYAVITQAQPDNFEARFFYLYSLFLANKMDRRNYNIIKEGFETLERNGYHRAEIQEVLDYITFEEEGLNR